MPEASSDNTTLSRETRLALVLYGGVSLAIYMNGIAHELYRAVRGQGLYQLVKRLTDSDIVVDVIAGTSAGGINGLLLAYALANECDFGAFAALWREKADIGMMIEDAQNATPDGLLKGETYYQPKLVEALNQARAQPAPGGG